MKIECFSSYQLTLLIKKEALKMDYQWLKTFIIAAETLNFRKASEKLMLSQPSVTVHIRLLEEQLGSKLFDRMNNRVTLSDAGKFFYPEAVRLTKDADASVNRMHVFSQGYRQQLDNRHFTVNGRNDITLFIADIHGTSSRCRTIHSHRRIGND